MSRGGAARYVAGATILALAFVAWVLLAPRQLGGSMSYAIVSGSSMEPSLGPGDLAVIRESGRYAPGDVVAYESDQLNRFVLHRIVRQEGDRYVLKGDGNDWLDSEKPTGSQLIGRLRLRVPGVGTALEKVRSPQVASPLVGLLGVAIFGASRRRSRRRRAPSIPRRDRLGREGRPGRAWPRLLAASILGLSAVAFSAVGLVAFTQRSQRESASPVTYEQRGSFRYWADAPPGPVYEGGQVRTGDPVFLQLIDGVAVSFTYEFDAEAPHEVSGAGRLDAELSDAFGWTHTVPIGSQEEQLASDRLTLTGSLDLAELRTLISKVERLTGVPRDVYTLNVVPRVDVSGTLSGRRFEDAFSPRLSFSLDALQLRPASAGSTAEPAGGDPLRPSSAGALPVVTAAEVGRISILDLTLDPSAARRLAVIGGSASLIALIALLLLWPASGLADEPARIQARYGRRLVPVAQAPRPVGYAVEVANMKALVRLADEYEEAILHARDGAAHSYVVAHDGMLYVYRALGEGADAPAESPVADRRDLATAPR